MQQFLRAKEQYPDAIVFFRLGDFYEMFFEDAVRASELLDIALTARGTDPEGNKIPMAGVPHHSAAGYLANGWFMVRHPDYDDCRGILGDIGQTVRMFAG